MEKIRKKIKEINGCDKINVQTAYNYHQYVTEINPDSELDDFTNSFVTILTFLYFNAIDELIICLNGAFGKCEQENCAQCYCLQEYIKGEYIKFPNEIHEALKNYSKQTRIKLHDQEIIIRDKTLADIHHQLKEINGITSDIVTINSARTYYLHCKEKSDLIKFTDEFIIILEFMYILGQINRIVCLNGAFGKCYNKDCINCKSLKNYAIEKYKGLSGCQKREIAEKHKFNIKSVSTALYNYAKQHNIKSSKKNKKFKIINIK